MEKQQKCIGNCAKDESGFTNICYALLKSTSTIASTPALDSEGKCLIFLPNRGRKGRVSYAYEKQTFGHEDRNTFYKDEFDILFHDFLISLTRDLLKETYVSSLCLFGIILILDIGVNSFKVISTPYSIVYNFYTNNKIHQHVNFFRLR